MIFRTSRLVGFGNHSLEDLSIIKAVTFKLHTQPIPRLHPRNLTWNLKISPWKRKVHLEAIIFRFHVKFRGGKTQRSYQASNPDMPVLRIDAASLQIYWSWRIFKEALMLHLGWRIRKPIGGKHRIHRKMYIYLHFRWPFRNFWWCQH